MDILTPVGILASKLGQLGRFVLGKTPPAGREPCPYRPAHVADAGWQYNTDLIGSSSFANRILKDNGTAAARAVESPTMVALVNTLDSIPRRPSEFASAAQMASQATETFPTRISSVSSAPATGNSPADSVPKAAVATVETETVKPAEASSLPARKTECR